MNKIKKISLCTFSILFFLNASNSIASVKYVSASALGYKIAQDIIKDMPNAKRYEYNIQCMIEAKKHARMGYNIRVSTVSAVCLDYTLNRDKRPPKTKSATYLIDDVKN